VERLSVEPYAPSGTNPVDEAQKQVVAEWVKNQTITTGLIGVRIGISDAAVIGALSLFVITIWLYFTLRRANRTIGYLLRDVRRETYDLQNLIFHGIAARLVFSDIGRGDQPMRSLAAAPDAQNVPFVRFAVKILFFIPAATIFFVILMDVLSLFYFSSPFRTSHEPLVRIINASPDAAGIWTQIVVWELLALTLGVLTVILCWKGLEFERGTEQVIRQFIDHLGKIDDDPSSLKSAEGE
jgi:hypothetical protein